MFSPIIQRRYEDKTKSGEGLQLAGNPIILYTIRAEQRDKIMGEWIRILTSLPTVPSILGIAFEGCNINDGQLNTIIGEALKKHNLVESIDLGGNEIADVTVLSMGLPNLKILILTSNQIIDISALGRLHNLKNLKLGRNLIKNVASLSSLINLENLYGITSNPIDRKDIASLKKKIS